MNEPFAWLWVYSIHSKDRGLAFEKGDWGPDYEWTPLYTAEGATSLRTLLELSNALESIDKRLAAMEGRK